MKSYNLSCHNGKIYKVLSSIPLGKKFRSTYNLDALDQSACNELVIFEVPDIVYSLNPSFFIGMFQKSISTLGESKFKTKYVFHCNNIIRKNIEDGIALCIGNH